MKKSKIILIPLVLALAGCGKAGPAAPAGETWTTASIAYEEGGDLQPAYYVQFTQTEVLYGHWREGGFVLDHADPIVLLTEAPTGGIRVQAQAANGVRYTYQTSEGDPAVLEYYETWEEGAFGEAYRGGSSLTLVKGDQP